jgi:hypothetical protein
LIGQQLKTGVLNARQGKDVVEIHFIDGMIVDVTSSRRGKGDLIGGKLVRARLITQEQLDRALKIQKGTLKFLGEILVELQLLSKDDLFKVISTQVCETIYDLFWWEDGDFHFDLKKVEGYKKLPFALSAEQALLNILRMVDEWPEIEKKIPSSDLTFRRVPGTEKKGYTEGKLSPDQEAILNLVNETLTTQDIIERSLLGKFYTSEILVNLMEMGLIEAAGLRPPGLMKKMGMINLGRALSFGYYGAFLFLVLVMVAYFKPDFLHHVMGFRIERPGVDIPFYFVRKAQVDRIKNGLKIYYLEKGEYPQYLEELIRVRLLGKGDLIDFRYERRDGEYSLSLGGK